MNAVREITRLQDAFYLMTARVAALEGQIEELSKQVSKQKSVTITARDDVFFGGPGNATNKKR